MDVLLGHAGITPPPPSPPAPAAVADPCPRAAWCALAPDHRGQCRAHQDEDQTW